MTPAPLSSRTCPNTGRGVRVSLDLSGLNLRLAPGCAMIKVPAATITLPKGLMDIIPDFVPTIMTTCWSQLIQCFSDQVYAELIKRDPNHLLAKLRKHLDFSQLESVCAGFHHNEGPGAKPTHPVRCLVRALLVGYLFNPQGAFGSCSLRQLEWHVRYNMVVKWFVGYPILAAGPDHTTLERFELIYDSAAGTGKSHAQVTDASGGQTQLVAPLIDYDKTSQRFSPQDFQLSEDGSTLTCPNGRTTPIAYRSGSGDGRNFRFLGHLHCAACPLWEHCRTQKPGSKAIRNVFTPALAAQVQVSATTAASSKPPWPICKHLTSKST